MRFVIELLLVAGSFYAGNRYGKAVAAKIVASLAAEKAAALATIAELKSKIVSDVKAAL